MRLTLDRDISIELSCFLMKFTGIWLAANRVEGFYRKLALVYTFIVFLYGAYIDLADIYYTWGDFGYTLYMTTNVMCIVLTLFKIIMLLIRKVEFKELVLYAQQHFWHSNYDSYEKSLIEDCRKFYTLCVFFTYFISHAALANYILTPLMANIGRNKSDRVLPFNVWINLPLNISPYYELMFTWQVMCVYQIIICYISFDNFLYLINTHVACQFRILQYRMTNLFGIGNNQVDVTTYTNKCYTALKKCVQQHQALIEYCNRTEHVFTSLIFGNVTVFSALICLDGYQILLADSSATRRFIFIFHLIGTAYQLLLFTNSCQSLIEESGNISRAIYSGPWTALPMNGTGRIYRKNLKMIIMRSQQPCYLTAGGFFAVSLETCTTILSTAMSYFTLLRESSVAIEEQ